MPMPELPVTITDPTHNTQRDGVRDMREIAQTHRGTRRDASPASDKLPNEGAIRYEE